ncbi:unnamed protein product [Didymodactylos carnosus]|uniref:Uncharacterized protein n=1 Tax=Didymodactylos carnosus TaxID=1234261 RepID=A0A814KKB4_9BILA|nr:unnamed protein product [Didymodactylos carnosus]CAF1052516.1 unnamed protein product [Didymodactylos carnosus]CAF3712227.1 unnamed protein product [Didymodactylos carnosus]CAF3821936.1 unnamed protein product [Didymodactylos carnosus]
MVSDCITCGISVGTFSCAGCKEFFCAKHVINHRQALLTDLNLISDDHNTLLNQINDFNQLSAANLLEKIDQWTEDTIQEVIMAADQARTHVRHLINERKVELRKKVQVISSELRTRRETDDYFEDDLTRLKKQIQEIRDALQTHRLPSVQIISVDAYEQFDWNNLIQVQKLDANSIYDINYPVYDRHLRNIDKVIDDKEEILNEIQMLLDDRLFVSKEDGQDVQKLKQEIEQLKFDKQFFEAYFQ